MISRDGGSPRPCPPGTIGRVQIRGPGVITEYAEGGPAGAIDADGWLETGDLGHLDRDGYLFLAGRSDDVINRGGEKIYPREIEEFLLTQPGVRSAVVVAARDDVLGQRPVAYVVPAAGPGGPLRIPLRTRLRARVGRIWPRRCAPRVRRRCRGPSGRPSSAWCRSCPSARRARSPGAVCGNWSARPADPDALEIVAEAARIRCHDFRSAHDRVSSHPLYGGF